MDTILTQGYVQSIFDYDPETGLLTWKNREDRSPQWNGRYAYTEAGCPAFFERGGPYRFVNIENTTHLVHRVIWLYVYGTWPNGIDHKDTDGLNNKLLNLREATQSQQNANRYLPARGYVKHGNKYRARIKVNGQQIELGSFSFEEQAKTAYLTACDKYYGEFAQCNRST